MKKALSYSVFALLFGLVIGYSLHGRVAQTDLAVESPIKRNYRMLVVYRSWPGWEISRQAMNKMAEALPGMTTTLSGPSDGNVASQSDEIDVLIRQKIDGIILAPGSDPAALVGKVNEAADNDIPVVTLYDDVAGSKRLTFVTTDETSNAYNLAKRIFDELRPEDGVKLRVLVSYMGPGISNQVARWNGVRTAAEQAPWVELVEDEPLRDQADDAKAAEQISAAMVREKGNIQLIMGLDARSAIGGITALKEQGMTPGTVCITGWDSDVDLLAAVQQGWVKASVAPNAGVMTQVAVSMLEAHRLGYLYSGKNVKAMVGMTAMPERINVEPVYIDADNVDMFIK